RRRLEQITVDPRWRTHRARDRSPQRLVIGKAVAQTRAGFEFESGVVVVFELRAERQVQSIIERDLVLPKTAVEILGQNGWQKCDTRCVVDGIVCKAVAKTPLNKIAHIQIEVVLEVDVVGIQIVRQYSGRRNNA